MSELSSGTRVWQHTSEGRRLGVKVRGWEHTLRCRRLEVRVGDTLEYVGG